jgi:hypothetical protein
MRHRLSPDDVEAMMVPQLVEAIYPVLIPMEQQDCATQAQNHARMTALARTLWRSFVDAREEIAASGGAEKAEAELAALRERAGAREVWRHVTTGGLYERREDDAAACMEADRSAVAIYRSLTDGRIWVRPVSEFYDGRFVKVDASSPGPGTKETGGDDAHQG